MKKKIKSWKKELLDLMDKGNKRSIFGSEAEAYKGIEKIRKTLSKNR